MILTDDIITKIDEELFEVDVSQTCTLQQLDNLMSNKFGLDSVFKSNNKNLIAKARAGRLLYYYLDYQDNNNELSSCMLVLSYNLNIDDTTSNTLENALVNNISYSLLNLYTDEAYFYEDSSFYISDLDEDIQSHLRCYKELSEEERQELLRNYVDNGY